ncbi:unnamed protein product [Kuraishia capsulata CBS 1993]|uniref:cyclic pyranopterin monophosphate synthase n=1 Tax=Kuraishia capsulata CBS 1993 TaxID=1382522 RepID=W6MR84_9ASCO|nr:uncharacterized protein KUCA_T00005224001 [Kuraishia capsulata CBS 1993]CDK29236.1 unnamed protein product [Kuraishia capsulata CBS 1993]
MVDIHEKDITHRRAVAVGKIRFSNEHVVGLIQSNGNKKGDVFSVARVAGIMGVKRCSDLIPLCHPLQITKVKVELELNADDNSATCTCQVECTGKTGVEMEAMTGVTVALLTVYDMCKAVDKYMVIDGVRVEHKSGGKSGTFDLSDRK